MRKVILVLLLGMSILTLTLMSCQNGATPKLSTWDQSVWDVAKWN